MKLSPSLENNDFLEKAKNDLYEIKKYELHTELMKKIQKKEFKNEDFLKLSNGIIENLKIKSLNDTSKFTKDSVSLIYSLGINNFSLVTDENNNIYLIKIKNIFENNLDKNNQKTTTFVNQTNTKLRDNLYSSYDSHDLP